MIATNILMIRCQKMTIAKLHLAPRQHRTRVDQATTLRLVFARAAMREQRAFVAHGGDRGVERRTRTIGGPRVGRINAPLQLLDFLRRARNREAVDGRGVDQDKAGERQRMDG